MGHSLCAGFKGRCRSRRKGLLLRRDGHVTNFAHAPGLGDATGHNATAIGIVAAPAPALVEYALTKDAAAKLPAKDAPKIVVTLSDKSPLTLTRTSVDIKPDMCIWRGAVDGTDMPVTIMWWPRGKMAGLIQHRGHIYAIRHIGGEVHAIIETSEALMPEDHPPGPPSPRKDGAR